MEIEIVSVDYLNALHMQDLLALLSAYALDPMGGAKALSPFVKENLGTALACEHGAVSLLAYREARAIGLINAFRGFSTFACKPLLNIHDVVVLPEYRGQGIAGKMLQVLEDYALEQGCCKLTLEVLSENTSAQSSYRKFGFAAYALDPAAGHALFWEKPL